VLFVVLRLLRVVDGGGIGDVVIMGEKMVGVDGGGGGMEVAASLWEDAVAATVVDTCACCIDESERVGGSGKDDDDGRGADGSELEGAVVPGAPTRDSNITSSVRPWSSEGCILGEAGRLESGELSLRSSVPLLTTLASSLTSTCSSVTAMCPAGGASTFVGEMDRENDRNLGPFRRRSSSGSSKTKTLAFGPCTPRMPLDWVRRVVTVFLKPVVAAVPAEPLPPFASELGAVV